MCIFSRSDQFAAVTSSPYIDPTRLVAIEPGMKFVAIPEQANLSVSPVKVLNAQIINTPSPINLWLLELLIQ